MGLGGPIRYPGIEPSSAECKTSALPFVLSLLIEAVFLFCWEAGSGKWREGRDRQDFLGAAAPGSLVYIPSLFSNRSQHGFICTNRSEIIGEGRREWYH